MPHKKDVKTILFEALEKKDSQERAAYLESACKNNPAGNPCIKNIWIKTGRVTACIPGCYQDVMGCKNIRRYRIVIVTLGIIVDA